MALQPHPKKPPAPWDTRVVSTSIQCWQGKMTSALPLLGQNHRLISTKKSNCVMASHARAMLPMFMTSPDWHTPACSAYGVSMTL